MLHALIRLDFNPGFLAEHFAVSELMEDKNTDGKKWEMLPPSSPRYSMQPEQTVPLLPS